MRDFHDQKDTFKALHDMVAVEKHDDCKDVSWVAGQCYVIDIFLSIGTWRVTDSVGRKTSRLTISKRSNADAKAASHKAMAAALGLTQPKP